MPALTFLTPVDDAPAVELGNRRWRKQLLPLGEINYKGRKIRFDREYFAELARAWQERAFDLVPFQLATDANAHTNDPERTRGTVTDLIPADDGLDVIIETSEAGSRVIEENPGLGVSARIVEDLERADGKRWKLALQHVLGTLDPRLTGMRAWQAVEAANEHGWVVDLSGEEIKKETGTMADKIKAADIEGLDELIAGAVASALAGQPVGEDDDLAAELRRQGMSDADIAAMLSDGPEDDEEEDGDGEPGEEDDGLSDDEVASLLDALGGDEDDDSEQVREPVTATRDDDGGDALSLANAQIESQAVELARVRAELDKGSYESERRRLAEDFGIPPFITDLARPLLEGTGHTVELANGRSADAGAIVRKVFTEIGKLGKIVDFSGPLGSGYGEPGDEARAQQEAEERERTVKAAREQFSL